MHSFQASYSGDGSFNPALSSVVSYTVNQASSSLSGPSTTVQVVHGASGSILVTVAGQYSGSGIALPSGSVGYSIADSGNNVVASGSATMASGSATVPVANTLASGVLYQVTLNYSGDANYNAAAAATVGLRIGSITPTINWTQPAQITYGATLSGILNATATNNSASVPGSFTYTATPAGGSASTITSSSVLGAGTYTLTATFTPTNTTTYAAATSTISIVVNKATPTVLLVSSANPVLVTNAVTFTATVASTAGSPGGSVSFLDGTTLLGLVTLSSGSASYTASSLAAATHSITVVYSGNSNFASATSAAVSELVQDYSLSVSGSGGSSSGSNTQTAVPGGTATYTLALGPSNGATFPYARNVDSQRPASGSDRDDYTQHRWPPAHR